LGDRIVRKIGPDTKEKFEESLKKKLKEKIEQYQSCINRGQFAELGRLLLDDSLILILPSRKKFEGKRAVVNFWKKQKDLGLKTIKFEVIDVSIVAHETLIREGRVSKRFDYVASVIGTYSITRGAGTGRLDLPSSTFILKAPHQDDCTWGIGGQFLG
jgi:hypothetical protein